MDSQKNISIGLTMLSRALFLAELPANKSIRKASIGQSVVIGDAENMYDFEVIDSVFEGDVTIGNTQNIRRIIFKGCDFTKKFTINYSNTRTIHFEGCIFRVSFNFKQVEAQNIYIKSCSFQVEKEFILQEFKAKNFHFTNNISSRDIYIKPLSISNVVLVGAESKYNLTFSNHDNDEVIEKFSSYHYSSCTTNINVRSLSVRSFHLKGALKDASMLIANIRVFSGLVDNFSNFGTLKITNIHALDSRSILIARNSTFAKAEISRCNFSSFYRVVLRASSLIELVPVNNNWCDGRRIESDDQLSLRENFRQLKFMAGKNEDLISRHVFMRYEMRTYLRYLRQVRQWNADRVILEANFLSNNFGLGLGRVFLLLILTTAVWYTCIKYSLGHTKFGASLILDEIGRYLLFLNPIHFFEKIFITEDLNRNMRAALLFDSISRILGTYFIYQFIAAFRKYAR